MTAGAQGVRAIDRFCLVSANAGRLAVFYEAAFDARVLRRDRRAGEPLKSARTVTLAIGNEYIELITFDNAGKPYPADAIVSDVTFQHFAMVVPNIEEAYSRLRAIDGWQPISRGGPQQLPASTGGVTAFKFRDPEGHPLELIEFRQDAMPARWQDSASSSIVRGIDHTAISVADFAVSIAFYEALGLRVSGRSINHGGEQDRLDGIDSTRVEVIALTPPDPTPHIELLSYTTRRFVPAAGPRDIAATQVVFTADVALGALHDPDGHRLFVSAIE